VVTRTHTPRESIVGLDVSQVTVREQGRLRLVEIHTPVEDTLLVLVIHAYHT